MAVSRTINLVLVRRVNLVALIASILVPAEGEDIKECYCPPVLLCFCEHVRNCRLGYKLVLHVINFQKKKDDTVPLLLHGFRRAMNKRISAVAILLITSLCLSPLVTADDTQNIPTNAQNTGNHNSLVAALAQAELVATLEGEGPFTVFAPTDQAFADAGIDLAALDSEEGKAALTDILLYHVFSGSVLSSDVTDAMTATMVNGDYVSFAVGDEVKINDATVTGADVTASNGVIHVIDKVLFPPVDVFVSDGAMAEPYFSFYTDPAGENPLTEIDITKNYKFQRTNNPSTHPFYIGDAGYNTESSDNLIIVGDGSSSSGIENDQSFTVFFKDGFDTDDTLSYYCTVHQDMIATFALTTPTVLQDIPTVATNTGFHDTLVSALVKADLVTNLQSDGPFTVFAPTDQAFIDAGIDLDSYTTADEIGVLTDILGYHVYVGAVSAADVTNGLTVTMLNGDDVAFAVSGDTVKVGDANVTTADVIATNGVIHVIDKVLIPPADLVDIAAVATSTGSHDSLVAALAKADLVTTVQGEGPFTVFAPTDQAFTDAGIDLDAFNTDEEIATLRDILLYHVYSGSVYAADVTDGLSVTMANGDDASFTVNNGIVKIGDATVTAVDVAASNGVIHVIDKVLMPPADVADTSECSVIIGIDDTGLAFDQTDVSINVGETVCWIWEDESMAHNVAETTKEGDNERKSDGVYSGESATTVDFRFTFTDDTTFFYICEPHATMDMRGKITVGEGAVVEEPDPIVEPEASTVPGFGSVLVIISLLGALIVFRTTDRKT